MDKCLYCYLPLPEKADIHQPYHLTCSKKIFGSKHAPTIDYTQNEILELAKNIVKSQHTVTGVQAKLSINKTLLKRNTSRLTIVGFWGTYILKPQAKSYQSLPELEDVTMHLADLCKIKTVPHTLIRLKSGELAYITKRVDRSEKKKYHMEDMCQLTERLTEYKYNGSYEQIAKIITKYSAHPGLDKVNFYELVLFSFLTGNNDMHLKNFSLLKFPYDYNLSPAYDLVASELIIEGDDEELALNLNGKKKKLKKRDFEIAMKTSGLETKVIENIFKKFENQRMPWNDLIDQSFLATELKASYKEMLAKKFAAIYH